MSKRSSDGGGAVKGVDAPPAHAGPSVASSALSYRRALETLPEQPEPAAAAVLSSAAPLRSDASDAAPAPVHPGVLLPPARVETPTLGHALRARVRVLGSEMPLWRALSPVVAVAFVSLMVAFAAMMSRSKVSSPRASSRAPAAATPAASMVQPATVERLSDSSELLRAAHAREEQQRDTAKALRQRLAQDPAAINDPFVRAQLQQASLNAVSAGHALAAMAALPGPLGVDMLYEVWTGTASRSSTAELAQALLYSSDVRAKASEALAVALDLRRAETCEQFRALLPRAKAQGDRRSYHLLVRLKTRQGCGVKKRFDCYECLRASDALELATVAVKSRHASSPFEVR